jgi:hypothetical protein
MYTLLFILLAALAVYCIYRGVTFKHPLVIYFGIGITFFILFINYLLGKTPVP